MLYSVSSNITSSLALASFIVCLYTTFQFSNTMYPKIIRNYSGSIAHPIKIMTSSDEFSIAIKMMQTSELDLPEILASSPVNSSRFMSFDFRLGFGKVHACASAPVIRLMKNVSQRREC